MLNIGLSGGIASGKTVVCRVFDCLNIPIYYSDLQAKKIMNTSETIKREIVGLFGEQAYVEGQLNTNYISQLVFSSKENREKINSIVHPEVWKDQAEWFKNTSNVPYTITESALIFETGFYKNFDFTINVSASDAEKISRLMQRNSLSEQEALKRIQAQKDDNFRNSLASFTIFNTRNNSLIEQILSLHNTFVCK